MKEQPPKQIYKYLKFNKNTEDILKNRRFYLAGTNELNDLLDLDQDPFCDLSQENRFIAQLYMKGCRVTCFTERKNNMAFWHHYTENYQGICLEFNTQNEDLFQSNLIKVKYEELKNFTNNNSYFTPQELMATKRPEWSYEEEWRIINQPLTLTTDIEQNISASNKLIDTIIESQFLDDPNKKEKLKNKYTPEQILEFYQLNFELLKKNNKLHINFNESSLKNIYFGVKTSEEDIKNVKNWVSGIKHIQFYKMQINKRTIDFILI